MPLMLKLLLAVQVFSALAIIALVLLQQGKGADMGSAFGSGSAGSLFGATGAANFLSRATKWAAVVFFASTAGLAYVSHKSTTASAVDSGVMQSFPANRSVPQVSGAPAAPDVGASSVPEASSMPGAVPSVPGAGSTSATQPDASVPSAPTVADEKPAETPAK